MTAKLLLIHEDLETIQCIWAILDFIILAEYVLHDEKMLRYIEHVLYRLEKIKITFEQHRPINSKLSWPTFSYPKFHAISHFVQCIWNYGSMVNYNIVYNEVMYEYLLKAFYNRTNKKEYKLQIWQHNVRHININAMKDIIILEKVREKKSCQKALWI